MYKIVKLSLPDGYNHDNLIRNSDGAVIPFDEKNRDYVAYLLWLDEGNSPEIIDGGE